MKKKFELQKNLNVEKTGEKNKIFLCIDKKQLRSQLNGMSMILNEFANSNLPKTSLY